MVSSEKSSEDGEEGDGESKDGSVNASSLGIIVSRNFGVGRAAGLGQAFSGIRV